MLLKMPGIMAQGDFQANLARIQKQRGQESGRARRPRFLAEIRMIPFVDHVCGGGKGARMDRNLYGVILVESATLYLVPI